MPVAVIARRERKPRDGRAVISRPAQPDAGSTEKRDTGRAVNRIVAPRTGNPGPALVDSLPCAVMRRGETPIRRVDPAPAPWRQIAPLPVAERRPIVRHSLRVPDLAVGVVALPVAVRGERRNAGDGWRHGSGHIADARFAPPRGVEGIGNSGGDIAGGEPAADQ